MKTPTTKTKHTQLPWVQTHKGGSITSPSKPRSTIIYDEGLFDGEEGEANAEFIVRAVNSHYELLEALKECVEELNGANAHRNITCYVKGRQAIAKAEGRS